MSAQDRLRKPPPAVPTPAPAPATDSPEDSALHGMEDDAGVWISWEVKA